MMKKLKLAAILWLLSASAALALCERPQSYIPIAKRTQNAMLYEVSGCGAPTSYLFGTFHSDAPTLLPLVAHAAEYMARTQSLWVEIKATPADGNLSMRHLSLPPSHQGLKSLIGDELYAQTLQKIAPKLGLSEVALNRFRPWALALLVQYPPAQHDGIIVDARLQQMASAQNIPVHGLESLQSQFGIFHNMPKAMQINFLKNTLEDFDHLAPSIDALAALYQSQDLGALQQKSTQLLDKTAQSYPALSGYMQHHLIENRNRLMAKTILAMTHKSYFVAVGALHLSGDEGLLQLIEDAGYQIRPIPMR